MRKTLRRTLRRFNEEKEISDIADAILGIPPVCPHCGKTAQSIILHGKGESIFNTTIYEFSGSKYHVKQTIGRLTHVNRIRHFDVNCMGELKVNDFKGRLVIPSLGENGDI